MDVSSSCIWLWDVLSQDLTLWEGLRSPLLSWIGSCGILLYFAWHFGRLLSRVSAVRSSYARVWPTLTTLQRERADCEGDWLSMKEWVRFGVPATHTSPRPTRIDLDDLERLDGVMRQDAMFRRSWNQYRKTYIVEHVAWFLDPRVFNTRSAGEFFTLDLMLSNRLNLAFYNQLPGVITGMGLLLTFLAILIGLSRLHADGSQILGIQGLINGLAGKFLTSVVGLICANVFVLIEKSVVYNLTTVHQRLLDLLDDLFPRKTMEQMIENFPRGSAHEARGAQAIPATNGDRAIHMLSDRFGPSLTALTQAAQALSKWREEEPTVSRGRLEAELSRLVKDHVSAPLHDLNRSIQALIRHVTDWQGQAVRSAGDRGGIGTSLFKEFDERIPGSSQPAPTDELTGLRWFANWRQRSVAKGSA